ncbi:hypothetical protein TSUD_29750 [Trifolium subterraneum]|uniref:Uncharacterized protein n=1 Tax=Trifolium subterraneum TaxID=3900 RepID=A0A2Z6MBS6_TRISU|nr:hypothetical protein TSUD_29750 [Trifolium subterraneum]
MKGGFNEEKLPIGIPKADGNGRKLLGDVEKEEDGEPFIVEIVAIAEVAVEVREVGGGRAETGFGGGGIGGWW